MKVIALDAGGATLKASIVTSNGPSTASILANHVAYTSTNPSMMIMGQKLQEYERQRVKLRYLRPVQRGYCVNWNVESELWIHLLSNEILNVKELTECSLVVTAPLLAPTIVNETMDQVVFEEIGLQAYARVNAAESCVLSYSEHCEREYQKNQIESMTFPAKTSFCTEQRNKTMGINSPTSAFLVDEDPLRFSTSSCHLVVDSGFSFTHVVPVIDGKVHAPGVRRINVGGKLLTNYLKEIVSFRQWNVMDDTQVINELKETLCYCSMEFKNDLHRYHTDRQERKHWILPDFVHTFTGRCREDGIVQDDEEQLAEANDEVLFNPSDIGIHQAGIAKTIVQAVNACPEELSDAFYANILLVGGNTKFRNFRQRLERDLRSLVPVDFDIGLHEPTDPVLAAWQGCCSLARSDALSERVVSKKEYEDMLLSVDNTLAMSPS
ncbi:unnamed protein product [Peronospora belbahrii]|uniref:Actin-related protein 6 n=1 Tax=Peronospora belbahrii TaxID=622444 RepID=A0AAU9KTA6_9STRA|nr:unnamed protein product [Peronospora belbahrii]